MVFPSTQVIGRTPDFLAAPGMNDLAQLPAIHARAFHGEPQTIEFWGRRADGTAFPKEVTLSPGTYFGQKVVIAVARDVTGRKEREQELRATAQLLREREAYLKAIIENSLGSIWAIDREYNILYVNELFAREYLKTFGVQLRVGVNILELLPAPLRETWRQRYERAINNEHFVFEDKVEFGGAGIYIEVAVNPIVVDGQVVGASFYGSDITGQTLAKGRLRHETRLRELLIELSTGFINQPLHTLGATIQGSLAKLGEFVGADRAYVFGFDRAAYSGNNTFEWCREGITPQIGILQQVPFSVVDPWVQALDRGEIVHVPFATDLPPGSQRDLLASQDIKSLLNIPLMRGGACIGFVGFDSVRTPHTYSRDEQMLLHVYAEMLVNVLDRQDAGRSCARARRSTTASSRSSG
ncbi:MAG: PAS domain S-box protein [Ignavibacteriae bacterium]|nr:PAS domain S-box protein [Ignavibacteriota bacterium]